MIVQLLFRSGNLPARRSRSCPGRTGAPGRYGIGTRFTEGFSLIEVTLAIGVVAFAFVALLGLIPLGLSTFRKAMDASIGAEIGQRVLNDLQQSDFNTVIGRTSNASLPTTLNTILSGQGSGAVAPRTVTGTGYLSHRFFDDQGNEVVLNQSVNYNSTDPTPEQRIANHILYDVHTQIILQPQIPSKVNGDGADGFLASPSLANVIIQVFSNPGGARLPDDLPNVQASGGQSVCVIGNTSVPFTTYTGFLSQNSRKTPAATGGS